MRPQSTQTLGIIGIVMIATNAFFFLASGNYGDDHVMSASALTGVRVAFAISSVVVGGIAFLATEFPKLVGHGLGFVLAIASLVGGIGALAGNMPPVLGVTMLIVGALTGLLTFHSLRGSRVAWSFLVAIMTVMAIVTLFGAPKVRNLLHLGLWYAIMIPGVLAVGVVALGLVRRDYRDALPAKKPQTAAV